jgi:hypothetical protein
MKTAPARAEALTNVSENTGPRLPGAGPDPRKEEDPELRARCERAQLGAGVYAMIPKTYDAPSVSWGASLDVRVAEAHTFLSAIWSPLKGYFERVSLKPGSERADERAFFPKIPTDLGAFLQRATENGCGALVGLASRRQKRGKREDLRAVCAIRVDLDGEPDALRETLKSFPLPCSLLVESGGGLHPYWLLDEPHFFEGEEDVLRFETLMRALARRLGGDEGCTAATANVRLPGSVNFPTESKQERGRAPILVRLVECAPDRRYGIDAIEAELASEIEAVRAENARRKARPTPQATGDGSDDGLSIESVLDHLCLSEALKAIKDRRRSACPLPDCPSRGPRAFAVSSEGRGWMCHACKRGGNAVALAAAFWECGRGEARARLHREGAYGAPVNVAALVRPRPSDHPHESLADVLHESLANKSAVLALSRIGKGKTHEALKVISERNERFLVLVDDHTLGAEIVERLQSMGVEAARPLSIEEGCKNPEAPRVLGLGWSRDLACGRCPLYPEGKGCPYVKAVAQTHQARVAVLPKIAAHDESALERLLDDRACVVVEEDATNFLARPFEFARANLEPFRRELQQLDLDDEPTTAARDELVNLLRTLDAKLGERPDWIELRGDTSWNPTPILVEHVLGRIQFKLNELASEKLKKPSGPLPRNVLPVLKEVARRISRGETFIFLKDAKDDSFEVRIPNRVPKTRAAWLLDATANPDLISKLLGRALTTVGGGERISAAILQATEKTVWSRSHFGLLEGETLDESALEAVVSIVERIVRRTGWRTLGLVSFKKLVCRELGAVLVEAIRSRLPHVEVRRLWFGRLRGQNALDGVDGLVVVGTPTPNPRDVRSRALLLGATTRELLQRPRFLLVTDGDHTFPCWTYASEIMRRAWFDLVGADVVQACGRLPRGNRYAPVIFLLASALFVWSGKLVRGTTGELGLDGTAAKVVDAALKGDVEEGRAVGRKTIAKRLSRREDDGSIKRSMIAVPRWRTIVRLAKAHQRRLAGP